MIADGIAASDGDDGLAASREGATIRAAFENVTIPDDLAAAISKAYADLGGGPVAVRSSATAEDLVGAAFAGQQDTYLNVAGDTAVLDAVRRCWGSLWTERALAYRRHQEIESGNLQIAVVVQQMVEAEFAGVLFTANPVTGDRDEIVIDASSGLGEAVVAGLVTPDHYVLDGQGNVRERTPGRGEVIIRSTPGAAASPTRPTPVPVRPACPIRFCPSLRYWADPWPHTSARRRTSNGRTPTDGSGWSGASDDRPAAASAQVESHAAQARAPADGLHDGAAIPARHERWVRPGIGRMVERMLGEISGLRVDIGDVLPEHHGVVERFVPPRPVPRGRRPTRSPACRVGSAVSTRLVGPTTRGSSDSRRASPSSPPSTRDTSAGPSCCWPVAARSR